MHRAPKASLVSNRTAPMSASSRIADIDYLSHHVRIGPTADVSQPLLDHLVSVAVALKWESAATSRRRVVTAEIRQ